MSGGVWVVQRWVDPQKEWEAVAFAGSSDETQGNEILETYKTANPDTRFKLQFYTRAKERTRCVQADCYSPQYLLRLCHMHYKRFKRGTSLSAKRYEQHCSSCRAAGHQSTTCPSDPLEGRFANE